MFLTNIQGILVCSICYLNLFQVCFVSLYDVSTEKIASQTDHRLSQAKIPIL